MQASGDEDDDRPEALLAQFLGGRSAMPADMAQFRRGWCAVVGLALLDYLIANPASKKWRDARDWIFDSGTAYPNAFDNIVEFLDINPQRAKVAILRLHAKTATDPGARARVLSELAGQGNGTRRGTDESTEEADGAN